MTSCDVSLSLMINLLHVESFQSHSPPTSEVGGSNPGPYVGKLVVAFRWLAVYSTKL